MIGKEIRGADFQGLARYLAKQQERVSFTHGYNLLAEGADAVGVAREMSDVAAGNARCKTPVYHLSLSWHPDDKPTHAEMDEVARRVLARLGLQEHQALVVGHNDTAHAHVHLMVNRVHPDPAQPVWGRWRDGKPWTFRAVESELRVVEGEMGWVVTPGFNAPAPGAEPPPKSRTGCTRRMRFGSEITINVGPALQNARSWKELQAVLRDHGMHVEARPKGMVITDGSRYIGACRIYGLKGGRPDLEDRFGQPLEEFLSTGRSPLPLPMTSWVWKVRVDALYHARRHFNRTPELYAVYKDSVQWRAERAQEASLRRAERDLGRKRRALHLSTRAVADAARTRHMLLHSLSSIWYGHAGMEAAAALTALAAAITRLGVDGVGSLIRHRPADLGVPRPRQASEGDTARLVTEVHDYAMAQAAAPVPEDLAASRQSVAEAEVVVGEMRVGRYLEAPAAGDAVRRRSLSRAQRVVLGAYEWGDGMGVGVDEMGR